MPESNERPEVEIAFTPRQIIGGFVLLAALLLLLLRRRRRTQAGPDESGSQD